MDAIGPSINADHYEIEKFYRAIADREPTLELLQMAYDLFGKECNLRPPSAELRLASASNGAARG